MLLGSKLQIEALSPARLRASLFLTPTRARASCTALFRCPYGPLCQKRPYISHRQRQALLEAEFDYQVFAVHMQRQDVGDVLAH